MKRIIIIIPFFLVSLTLCNAQSISDVVRYSTENLQGTARYQAMSGAFGALGGDMTSILLNPAASAVFSSSKATISGLYATVENKASYFDNEEVTKDNNIDMNQFGGVFVFKLGNRDAVWKKITLGLNYNQTKSFNNEFSASGASNISIDQYFLAFANGRALGDIIPLPGESIPEAYLNIGSQLGYAYQQAFLGYQASIINSTDDTNLANTSYINNTGNFTTLDHQYYLLSEGNQSKYTLNLATQVSNFYVGASVNFHTLRYDRLTQFDESGYDPATTPLEFMYFDNLMRTRGNGFSFTVGAISKIKDLVRVGFSYQSPVSYTVTEELSQVIESNLSPPLPTPDFSLLNIFPDYKIHVPAKLTGSVAVVFGKHGVVSFDYDYQDFSNARLKPESDPYFEIQNQLISTRLKAISTYRIGGEYRVLPKKQLSIRAGYRLQESPYTNGVSLGDLKGYSFGLGYNFGGTQLDASFNQYKRGQTHQLFDPGFPNSTSIDGKYSNINLSLSFRL